MLETPLSLSYKNSKKYFPAICESIEKNRHLHCKIWGKLEFPKSFTDIEKQKISELLFSGEIFALNYVNGLMFISGDNLMLHAPNSAKISSATNITFLCFENTSLIMIEGNNLSFPGIKGIHTRLDPNYPFFIGDVLILGQESYEFSKEERVFKKRGSCSLRQNF